MRWILTILFFVLFEGYAFQAVRTLTQQKSIWMVYGFLVLVIFGNMLYQSLTFDRTTGMQVGMMYGIGFFISLFVFQLVLILFLLFEDIVRIPITIYNFFTKTQSDLGYLPGRRKLLSQIALGLAAVPLVSLLYGMYRGRYNYKVLHYALEYDDLPEAFDGFTMTQISDIHSGSFDNAEKVQYGVDLINEQKSDVIFFTGDLVNNKCDEVLPWVTTFSQLKATHGVYSVLGNHDYGDYADWENDAAKGENMERLYATQKKMGWDLLRNEARWIEKDGQKIAVVGVENWGKGGFKKAGDLNQALSGVAPEDFKILLSHDPSHWEAEVLPHPAPVQLTLSGHTHGMQFGIEIPGWFKWSPVQWRYKQWAGIYGTEQQRLNVNRGFGFLAYPGRVGMWPEITVITLKRTKATV
ncbi:metallophosphoesterase [Flavobacteriaceae bacterium]|jgi:uncharacterized protein|nr:metallophosphoesterase [Flavobacteriaceae bacterium]MDA7711671.1 metallophosphoesterase [Flavobacteriaceae bacterium]MDB4306735.1 metallophosphoesterase [Flavobacteriaceae bacterium]